MTCKCRGRSADLHYVINRRSRLDASLYSADPTSITAWYLLRCSDATSMCAFIQHCVATQSSLNTLSFCEAEQLWVDFLVKRTANAVSSNYSRHRRSSIMRLMYYRIVRSFYAIDISDNVLTSANEENDIESIELSPLTSGHPVAHPSPAAISPTPVPVEEGESCGQHPGSSNLSAASNLTPPVPVETCDVECSTHATPALDDEDIVPAVSWSETYPTSAITGELYVTRLKQYLRSCVHRSVAYFSPRDTSLSRIYALPPILRRFIPVYVFTDYEYFPYCGTPIVLVEHICELRHLPPRQYGYLVVHAPNTLDFTIKEVNLHSICGLPLEEAYALLKSVIGLKGFVYLKSPS